MQTPPHTAKQTQPQPASLASTLGALKASAQHNPQTLHSWTHTLGLQSFGLLLVILSLPSALPIPAAGYSVPFGLALGLLGLQMLVGRQTPWLPTRLGKLKLGGTLLAKGLGGISKLLQLTQRLVRPRLRWLTSRGGQMLLGALVVCMALLMCVPIPTTNTAPAFVIFLIGVALSEGDGLLACLAAFLGLAAVALYAFILYLFYQFFFVQGGNIEGFTSFVKTQLGL